MPLIQKYLRCNILRSATKRISPGFDDLREPEIGEFEVAVGSDQQVFGLQVSVDYVQAVHVFEHRGHGGSIETI